MKGAEMLKIGERLWNGNIVTTQLAEAYNRATVEIEKRQALGMNVDALLNGRHNLINTPKLPN